MGDPGDVRPGTLDRRRVVAAWRRLLREEEGVALIIALLVMLVLTIMLTSVILLTAAGARDAQRSNAGQRAYALAESGINNALAILNAAYPDTTHAYPGDKCLLHPQTIPAGFPGTAVFSSELSAPPTGCGATAKFSFTPDASRPSETASYWGSLRRVPGLGVSWLISSTGSVTNPTGPGASAVTRTLLAKVPVVVTPAEDVPPGVLNWLYSPGPGNTTLGQGVKVRSPLYVRGNLILNNTAEVYAPLYVTCVAPPAPVPTTASPCTAPTGAAPGTAGTGSGNLDLDNTVQVHQPATIAVGGQITQRTNNNTIGTSAARLSEGHVINGCFFKGQTLHKPCQWDADDVFISGAAGNTTMPPDPVPSPPTIDWSQWYSFASPGPQNPCDSFTGTPPTFDTNTTLDNSVGTVVNLTPATGYTCHTLGGDLNWNPTVTPKTLTVKGIIYLDASAQIDNVFGGQAAFKYSGQGLIYVSGSFALKNTKMCAVIDGTGNDCNTATNVWDPNVNALGIVANGTLGGQQAVQNTANSVEVTTASFQGILSGVKNIEVTTSSLVQGPIISTNGTVSLNQSTGASFPDIHFAPSGAPGNPPPPSILLAPREFGG